MITPPASLLLPALPSENRVHENLPKGTEAITRSFRELLREKLEEVNELQHQADTITQMYLAGQAEDVHQVMLALEQANLSLQMVMQVRNKVIEAYQEISRMQV